MRVGVLWAFTHSIRSCQATLHTIHPIPIRWTTLLLPKVRTFEMISSGFRLEPTQPTPFDLFCFPLHNTGSYCPLITFHLFLFSTPQLTDPTPPTQPTHIHRVLFPTAIFTMPSDPLLSLLQSATMADMIASSLQSPANSQGFATASQEAAEILSLIHI